MSNEHLSDTGVSENDAYEGGGSRNVFLFLFILFGIIIIILIDLIIGNFSIITTSPVHLLLFIVSLIFIRVGSTVGKITVNTLVGKSEILVQVRKKVATKVQVI